MEYVKINSLWKRVGHDQPQSKDKKLLIPGEYACPEFANIKQWLVNEKIDGTNIRIEFEPKDDRPLKICGRTSKAQIPPHLLEYLQDIFTLEGMTNAFPNASKVVLFGEGYGPKIQACGSDYRDDPGLILFDIWVSGWWLEQSNVKMVAEQLGLPYAPTIGTMDEDEVVAYVKSKPLSQISKNPLMMEGVICRSAPLVLFRNGNPVMFKLKCRDFK